MVQAVVPTNKMMQVYIGLGSNLDNPLSHVEQALSELSTLSSSQLIAHSALYRSNPQGGPPGQPDYINAVAMLTTGLSPLALLDELQAIERAHQRVRIEHWGPRTLDLDILLIDNLVINTERLTVPHPFLAQRDFVLYPLADITPTLMLPCGTLLQSLIACCPSGLERIE